MYCILLYMICFGDELEVRGLDVSELSWSLVLDVLSMWVCWGSVVRNSSLVHLKHSRTDRIS